MKANKISTFTQAVRMHEAYECIAVLEKLPLQIESIATYGKSVTYGT